MKVFLVNSGSEANDLALRLARACTKSNNVICVDHAYHGHTLATLDVSPYKFKSREFDTCRTATADADDGTNTGTSNSTSTSTPGRNIIKVPCPDTYRGLHRGEDAAQKYANYVTEACETFQNRGEKVGAFLLEGGMSVAGVILPPPSYLRQCVEAVRSAGGLYIADEVQTGFGRLGECFWAFEYGDSGVVPDIVTVGKPFGNGMPLAAVVTTQEVSDAFDAMGVEYFNTFGGNPVCAAAGLAVLDVIESEGLDKHAAAVGKYLISRFQQLKVELEIIGDVRGSGLFVGIELIRDAKTLEPATIETSFLCTRLKEEYRVLTSIDGPNDNVLVVKPPMVFSNEDVDEFVSAFVSAVNDLSRVDIQSISKTPT